VKLPSILLERSRFTNLDFFIYALGLIGFGLLFEGVGAGGINLIGTGILFVIVGLTSVLLSHDAREKLKSAGYEGVKVLSDESSEKDAN